MDDVWTVDREGEGPLVATALHAGHRVRPEVEEALALSAEERRREEDPLTDGWTVVAPVRVVVHRSRFEVDLNRPREEAVYGEEVWGLRVWRSGGPPPEVVARSLAQYDAFYQAMRRVLDRRRERHGTFVVLDLHSYNHRREGPEGPPADPAGNPDVNLGTGSLDRGRWGGVADAFLEAVEGRSVGGRALTVGENVRFRGGHFAGWVNRTFQGVGCALAIEVKKVYMDEWTGAEDEAAVAEVEALLSGAARAVEEALPDGRRQRG